MTFRILERQMHALGEQTKQRFAARMADYLRQNFTNWFRPMNADELSEWCAEALGKAERHGFTREPDAAQFMLLLAAMGLDAEDKYEWVSATLSDRQLQPVGKLRRLISIGKTEVPAVHHVTVFPEMES